MIHNTDYRQQVMQRLAKTYEQIVMLPNMPVEFTQAAAMRILHGIRANGYRAEVLQEHAALYRCTLLHGTTKTRDLLRRIAFLLCATHRTPSTEILWNIRKLNKLLKS